MIYEENKELVEQLKLYTKTANMTKFLEKHEGYLRAIALNLGVYEFTLELPAEFSKIGFLNMNIKLSFNWNHQLSVHVKSIECTTKGLETCTDNYWNMVGNQNYHIVAQEGEITELQLSKLFCDKVKVCTDLSVNRELDFLFLQFESKAMLSRGIDKIKHLKNLSLKTLNIEVSTPVVSRESRVEMFRDFIRCLSFLSIQRCNIIIQFPDYHYRWKEIIDTLFIMLKEEYDNLVNNGTIVYYEVDIYKDFGDRCAGDIIRELSDRVSQYRLPAKVRTTQRVQGY